MQLNIGDKVKFLNDEGGGTITQLIDKDTVMVLSEIDNFEIPALIKELIPQNPSQSTVNKGVDALDGKARRDRIGDASIMFAQEAENYDCFLVNGQERTLFFGIFEQRKEGIIGVFSGMLQPYGVQQITNYSLKELNAVLEWKVQGFYFEKQVDDFTAPLDCTVKMQPKKLFNEGSKKFIEEIGRGAVVIPLQNKKQTLQKQLTAADFFADNTENIKRTSKPERKNTSDLLEVDLHINELLESTKGMSNGEMLTYQLDTFRKVLIENQKNKGRKIVFIHGVGNGVLKQRIRHELQKYPRYIVQDASFQEYGWGATMVIIK